MLRSILVGLDGSTYGPAATELAIRWSKVTGCEVVGLSIIDEPGITSPVASPMASGNLKEERDHALLQDAERQTSQFLEEFSLTCTKSSVPSKVLQESGSPDQEILEEAQRFDLILLGRETFFKFETQNTADTTLQTVVKISPRPVVVVPDKLPTGKNIIVAYDGSAQAARALQLFALSGIPCDGEVHIVSIHENKLIAAKTADRAVEYLQSHGIKALPHRPDVGSSHASVLIEHVRKLDGGLMVMGAFGESAWKSLFFGSTTRRLIQDAGVPLFMSQ